MLTDDEIKQCSITLPSQDLINLCNCSSRFIVLAQNDEIWNSRCIRNFNVIVKSDKMTDRNNSICHFILK
jgi:hypothetical protein